MWNWLRGKVHVGLFEEAELHCSIYKASPSFHLKVLRDEPTTSSAMNYSNSYASMFISKEKNDEGTLLLEPEVHLVEIDGVAGKDLVSWDKQYRAGQLGAVVMQQRDFGIKEGKRAAKPTAAEPSPKKMMRSQSQQDVSQPLLAPNGKKLKWRKLKRSEAPSE
eukprot:Phypoly_transcript_13223.p1 GENE.Phypoly_transcript_13223~~Phypoly_transcript_13223.p1  ORF type:complete len:163 (+),score=37.39 Phypoly_transcript_13223:547-1035(+)